MCCALLIGFSAGLLVEHGADDFDSVAGADTVERWEILACLPESVAGAQLRAMLPELPDLRRSILAFAMPRY